MVSTFGFNLEGYLANEKLPISKPLIPLFEAISNAIHATEDANAISKKINIHIVRETSQSNIDEKIVQKAHHPITGFVVTDNGIGFNDENYNSFTTSYSQYKKDRGGKGVGRLSWLKAFDYVDITSVYMEEEKHCNRSFIFSKNGIEMKPKREESDHSIGSRIELVEWKAEFSNSKHTPKQIETIANRILEHSLFAFLSDNPPLITVTDDDTSDKIVINDLFKDSIDPYSNNSDITIEGIPFQIRNLKVYSGDPASTHSIHLCANDRDVEQMPIEKKIPALTNRLANDEGKLFHLLCYVKSPFLDAKVNSQRTGFNFSKSGELEFDQITEEKLFEELVRDIKGTLGDDLDTILDRVKERVENIVNNNYPEFRPYVKEMEAELDTFTINITEDEIARRFNEYQFKRDTQTRGEAKKLLEKSEKGEFDADFQTQFEHYLENVEDAAQVNLSRYVINRKAILNILEKRLEADSNGKYSKEELIHEVIFPMRKTSDEVEFHNNNLWIIDEKLSFHSYLGSDKPLTSVQTNGTSSKRPDLLITNGPSAFSDNNEMPLNSVVVVEFKKPERKNYGLEGSDKNPVDQVTEYIDLVRSNEALTYRGREITVGDSTPFYCYIIADLTKKLRKILKGRGFIEAPDKLGYFWYNNNNMSYYEVISFQKLLQDAKKRNHALFTKLKLL